MKKPTPSLRLLILGAGPAAIQLAGDVSLSGCLKLGLYNRPSHKGHALKTLLASAPYLNLTGAGSASHLDQRIKINQYYDDTAQLGNDWDIVVLAVPADAYQNVITGLTPDLLAKLGCLILLSPSIGSALLVQNTLRHHHNHQCEVISLSSYYADTKYIDSTRPNLAVTKAFKKRIYLGSSLTNGPSVALTLLQSMLNTHQIEAIITPSPLAAERFAINNYVHPPMVLSALGLTSVFQPHAPTRYIYKLYPEGPITPATLATMLRLWQDYSALLTQLGTTPINLLQFLNDDAYPVPEEILPRLWIDQFITLPFTSQLLALYVRYSALLVDPYSTPDAKGRYFDFSAVPFNKVYLETDGLWHLPRVPLEDYKKLKTLCCLGRLLAVPMTEGWALIRAYEDTRDKFVTQHTPSACHSSMTDDPSEAAAMAIWQQWLINP